MNKHNEETEKGLENLARKIPVPGLPDRTWKAIEQEIRRERVHPEMAVSPKLKAGIVKGYAFRLSMASLLIMASISAWYLMDEPVDGLESLAFSEQSELLESADDDLDMAIYYYERAIQKLERGANTKLSTLNPQIASLYEDKIGSLKFAIAECKQVLKYNGAHPQVRESLFASYIELEFTLAELGSSRVSSR